MDTAQHSSDEAPKTRRISGYHIVLGIGVGFALITAASGVLGTTLDWHDDSPESREVFGNIPGSLELAFYVVLVVLIVAGGVQFANRVKNWQRGLPDNRATTVENVGRRLSDFRSGVYMQTLLREPAAGIMHSLIYFSFLILLAVTTVLEIDHQMPESAKFLHGGAYQGFSLVGDVAGGLLLLGVLWAIARRYGPRNWRPYRIRIKSKPEHAIILGTFLVIAVSGFLTEMFRIALAGRPDFEVATHQQHADRISRLEPCRRRGGDRLRALRRPGHHRRETLIAERGHHRIDDRRIETAHRQRCRDRPQQSADARVDGRVAEYLHVRRAVGKRADPGERLLQGGPQRIGCERNREIDARSSSTRARIWAASASASARACRGRLGLSAITPSAPSPRVCWASASR